MRRSACSTLSELVVGQNHAEIRVRSEERGQTSNGINMATVVTEREKFELPSTDASVAVSSGCGLSCLITRQRAWFSMSGGPTDGPRSRRAIANGVVALKDPSSAKVAFFVMVGHSFGLVSAVYNYRRPSAAVTDILATRVQRCRLQLLRR